MLLLTNPILDKLVLDGIIHSYSWEQLDQEGNSTQPKWDSIRNIQRLIIVFNNFERLIIKTEVGEITEDANLLFEHHPHLYSKGFTPFKIPNKDKQF